MGSTAPSRALWLAASLWFGSDTVRADAFHYQRVPLGERSLGMGGAFTGVANDPSASYYNPAGLVQLGDTALSGSLTISAFDRQTIQNGYRTPQSNTDLKTDTRPALPVFVGLVKQLGRRDKDNLRRHAVALSTFNVGQRNLDFEEEVSGQGANRTIVDTISVQDEQTTIWHGLSYSYRYSDRLSFGVSTFLALYRMSHREEGLNLTLGQFDPSSGTYANPTVALQSRRTSSDVKAIVARLGMLYAVTREVSLGVMLQLPGVHITGSADVRERVVVANSLMPENSFATYFDDSQANLSAEQPVPWELRVGSAWALAPQSLLALDVSLYGKNGTKNEPVIAIETAAPDPETGRIPQPGDFVVRRYRTKMTANVSVGAERTFQDALVGRVGLFTDLSAAPPIPATSDNYYAPDINRLGGTGSVGLVAGGFDLSIGVAGSFGWGSALAYNVDPQPGSKYRRADATEQTLFVFLSGAKRAFGRLAELSYQKLQEIREERERERSLEETLEKLAPKDEPKQDGLEHEDLPPTPERSAPPNP